MSWRYRKIFKNSGEFQMDIQSLWTTVSEMKHTMEGFKSRLETVEEMVNGLKIREEEYKEAEAEREKKDL